MGKRFVVRTLVSELAQKRLAHIPNAAKEAQLLLLHYLGKDTLWFVTNQNSEVELGEDFFVMVQRRANNEPLEYITNKVSFYSEEFYIDEGALIPRPETELLIDEVKKRLERDASVQFVEVGVGSGIISIMLALHFHNAKFIAVDISPKALEVAKKNIAKFDLEDRIELRQGSLLDCIDEKVDYLVSNPPYIANDAELESNLAYEPQNALFGGEVGDEIIKQLLDELLKREIKLFSCEIGYDQKDKIHNYLKNKYYKSLDFYKDYAGFDRGFTLEL